MDPITKSFPASFKALGPDDGEPEGTFEAMVAVFDNVDKVGDRIGSKAFDKSLEAWRNSGDPIPVILSHKWDDPFAVIGHADPANVKAIEGRGLYVKGVIDHLDLNPVAAQVHRLMVGRVLKEFSFGYTVPKGGEKKAKDGAYDLSQINLIEIGPTLKGINPETELLSVKSALDAHNRRKNYVDVEVPGSFEQIQDSLRAALSDVYPTPTDSSQGWVTTNIVATTASEVTYQVCTYADGEKSDVMYRAPYELDADAVATIGDAVEVETQIVEKADLYKELVKLAVEFKALDQLAAEEWARGMVDTEFVTKDDADAEFKDYSTEQRIAMAKRGEAMPIRNDAGDIVGGAYPIANLSDLEKAIRAIGRASDPAAARKHIMKRARALGHFDLIPDTWKSDEEIETPAEPEPEVKSGEVDDTISKLRLEQAEHEVGKAMSADALEAAALDRQLAVELAQFGG